MKKGDIVRFLNSTGGGRVVRIEGQMAYVEDEDGFEVPELTKECVVVADADSDVAKAQAAKSNAKSGGVSKTSAQASKASVQETAASSHKAVTVEPDPELVVEETAHGDKLNVVLAFEPTNLKSLSNSAFDCVLVNDSNYYLNFVFATRPADSQEWTVRKAGVVEPNIILSLCEFAGSDFAEIDRLNIQFVAYKEGHQFELKRPISVIHKIDATKFFKLHCFQPGVYFDEPVLSYEIVKDDEPYRQTRIDPRQVASSMHQKIAADRQPRRPVVRRAEQKRQGEAIVVDLHIDELVDTTRGLSAADMLNLQVDEFRRVMDANANNKGQKIIFIHGKGEGVLRQALVKELNYRYKRHQVEDAPFRDFGSGATMVIIR